MIVGLTRRSLIAAWLALLTCGASGPLLAVAPGDERPVPPLHGNWTAPATWYRAGPAPAEQAPAPARETPFDPSGLNNDVGSGRFSLSRTPLIVAPLLAYTYTPIAPCRQYNTISPVNPLLQGTNRAVAMTGAPCNIPASAVAISANVTVFNITGAGGNGVFKVDTVSPPASAWINYPATEAQRANAGVLALNASGQIIVQVAQGAGQVDFVVDVNGFYSATTLDAAVNGDGSLARGTHTTGAIHLSTGAYEVDFDRDVSACFWTATIANAGGGAPVPGSILLALRSGNNNAVFAATRDNAATLTDNNFMLHVSCPP